MMSPQVQGIPAFFSLIFVGVTPVHTSSWRLVPFPSTRLSHVRCNPSCVANTHTPNERTTNTEAEILEEGRGCVGSRDAETRI